MLNFCDETDFILYLSICKSVAFVKRLEQVYFDIYMYMYICTYIYLHIYIYNYPILVPNVTLRDDILKKSIFQLQKKYVYTYK